MIWPFLRVSGNVNPKSSAPVCLSPTSGPVHLSLSSLPKCERLWSFQGELWFQGQSGPFAGVYVCVCTMAWFRRWRRGAKGQRLGLGAGVVVRMVEAD